MEQDTKSTWPTSLQKLRGNEKENYETEEEFMIHLLIKDILSSKNLCLYIKFSSYLPTQNEFLFCLKNLSRFAQAAAWHQHC